MFLEVIGLDAADVRAAQEAGASRIELVSSMDKGGLSPEVHVLEAVMSVATIPVRVMVRFHDNGFVYSREEVRAMCEWMEETKHLPFDGFVLGGLTPDGKIDTDFLERALQVAGDKKITFHRAFDEIEDQVAALQVLKQYPISTILTSGGLVKPIDENIGHLDSLQQRAPDIQILAGGGVNARVIEKLKPTAVQSYHVGSAVRLNGDFATVVDKNLVDGLMKL